jgi:Spy/CpxP family protein refolding chaperone
MLSRILAVAMVFAAIAAAQRPGGGGGAPSGPAATDAGGWGSAHARFLSPFEQLAVKLKLDKDQRAAAEPIVDAAQTAMVQAQQKLVEARKELVLAMLDPKTNPDEVAKLTAAYTALSAQAKTLESAAFGKICALLKPNQLSKAVPTFALLARAVEQGPMGAPSGQWGGPHGGQR